MVSDPGFHKCEHYDYCILSDKEFLLFCRECKKAAGVVEFKIVDELKKKQYDSKTLEDLK